MNFTTFATTAGIATRSDYVTLRDLFSTDDEFFSYEEKSRLLFFYEKLFESGRLNVTEFLVIVLVRFKNKLDLVLVSFLLRLGADPNIYVPRSDVDHRTHILIFAIGCLINNGLRDTSFFSQIISLFRDKGTILDRPSYLPEEKKEESLASNLVTKIDPEFSSAIALFKRTANIHLYSVRMWIETQLQIKISPSLEEDLNSLSDSERILFGLLSDNPIYAFQSDEVPSFLDVILNRAIKVGRKYPLFTTIDGSSKPLYLTTFRGMTECYERCASSIFTELYKFFIDSGVKQTYFDVNYLIASISINEKEKLAEMELFNLLKYCVSRGMVMDLDQLRNFNEPRLSQILDTYREPFWRKECRTLSIPRIVETELGIGEISSLGSEFGSRMRKLITGLCLSVDTSKEVLCKTLESIFVQKDEDYISAFKKRQQSKLTAEISTPEDWLNGIEPLFVVGNQEYFISDPLHYNDLQLCYYESESRVDAGGRIEGKIYCFASDAFRELIRTRKNPIDGTPLRPMFLIKVNQQLEVMQTLGIDPNEVIPIEQTLRMFRKNDEISNDESNVIKSTIEEMMIANGYGKDYLRSKSNSNEYITSTLKKLDYDQLYLPYLRGESRYTTFVRALTDGILLLSQDQRRVFFSGL